MNRKKENMNSKKIIQWRKFDTLMHSLIKLFILDSINNFKKIGEMYLLDANTNNTNDSTLVEFQEKYMKEGWELISGTSKFMMLSIFSTTVLFLKSDNPYYNSVITLGPILFVLFVTLDKIFESNKAIRESSFYIMQFFGSIIVFYDSYNKPSFRFNEQWLPFCLYSIYLWIFSFMNWRKLAMMFYFTIISFLIAMNVYWDIVPQETYVSFICTCIYFAIIWVLISLKLKEILALLKSNKDLIHTIQKILQVFPEGVIIRSLDETSKQTIMKFANNIANKDIIIDNEMESKVIVVKSENLNQEDDFHHYLSIKEFLSNQEIKLQSTASCGVDQMIWIKKSIDNLHEEFVRNVENDEMKEEIFFIVKSIKVNWKNNEDSFMHVFINTTQVKKLEEERANREHQHMMFASLSHELRTPLNAFSNSLNLIQYTFDEIKSK